MERRKMICYGRHHQRALISLSRGEKGRFELNYGCGSKGAETLKTLILVWSLKI